MRRLVLSVALAAASTAFAYFLILLLPQHFNPDHQFADIKAALFSPKGNPQAAPVVLVPITNDPAQRSALDSFYPMDRDHLADLIVCGASASPAAIGIDLLFDWPSNDVSKDINLASIISKSSATVPIVTGYVPETFSKHDPINFAFQKEFIVKAGSIPGDITLLRDSASRRIRFALGKRDDELVQSFAFELAKTAGLSHHKVPERFRIRWQKTPNFSRIPASMLLDSCRNGARTEFSGFLRNKILIIGIEFPNDVHETPLSLIGDDMFGMAIHAQIATQMLSGVMFYNFPIWISFILAFMFAFGAILVDRNMFLNDIKSTVFIVVFGTALTIDFLFYGLFKVITPIIFCALAYQTCSFILGAKELAEKGVTKWKRLRS